MTFQTFYFVIFISILFCLTQIAVFLKCVTVLLTYVILLPITSLAWLRHTQNLTLWDLFKHSSHTGLFIGVLLGHVSLVI
jgi:hypothetical protein